ncbi:MAG: DEAD/DEAH box helicase [Planctomycetaceae bacterium]|nr:DEAD/DEAH box helicase [Planctomycetaceae bacterium]
MNFSELGLAAPLLRALAAEGYSTPTPIQALAIPPALAGQDVLGCAQTGTGKTAAFALPLLHRLLMAAEAAPPPPPAAPEPQRAGPPPRTRGPGRGGRPQGGRYDRPVEPYRPTKVLVLAPTRELAVQIAESIHDYGEYAGVKLTAIYGGVGYQRQIQSLRRGIDILVATPGRLVDLMDQGYVDFSTISAFVLDEADRMLDMGFMPDLRKIISKLPKERQTLFFSATMPPEIAKLANELLRDPARVTIAPEKPSAERIEQTVCFVPRSHKSALLTRWLADHQITRAIVFTRTKHGADRVARQLEAAGVRAEAIHGNKSQNARQRALQAFRESDVHVLVATDLAARGIDVDGISHVFNYDLPIEPETYVHRIGRTARAGASGIAVSFCDREERGMLRGIERLLKRALRVETNLPVVVPLDDDGGEREELRPRGPRRPPNGGGQRRAETGRREQRPAPAAPRAAAAGVKPKDVAPQANQAQAPKPRPEHRPPRRPARGPR